MSSRRVLAAGVVVGLLAPVALMSPASAVERPVAETAVAAASAAKKAKAKALTASVAPAVAGERITFTAKRPKTKKFRALKAKKQRKARLVLQRRDGKKWRSVARTQLKSKKKVTFDSRVPTKAKKAVRYRVRAVVGKKQYAAGSLRLKVAPQRLAVAPSSTNAEADVTYASRLTPVRAGREVVLERWADGAWSTVEGAALQSAAVNLSAPALNYPAWYRVSAAAHNGIAAVRSKPVLTTFDRALSEVAHRAGASLAPEQTLAALEAAVASGAPSMEIDVQLTSDRVPVIVHDQTFARTTNVAAVFPGRESDPVGSFTWAEVQKLDAGSWFGAQWAGEKIPSLDQWIRRLAGRTHLVLEVKFHPNNQATPEQLDQMRAVLDRELATGLLGGVAKAKKLTVSSFNHNFLQPFAEAHPGVPVGALTITAPDEARAKAWAAWAEEVHSMTFFTKRENTDAVRAAGLTTSVWTLRTVDDYYAALLEGAERFITDIPGTLEQILNPPAPTH